MKRQWSAILPLLIALSLLSILAAAITVEAQVGLPPLTPYSQNFDSLASSGTSSTLPSGWFFSESGTNANTTYTAGTGSSTTGDTYSFGAAASTERALGGLQSGSLIPTIGAGFVNSTTGTIGQLSISYNCEQWRLGTAGRADRLDFQYSTDAISLTSGTWTDFNPLDCTGPITTGTVGALDGNAAANRITVTAVLSNTGVFSVPNGSTFWIRWTDFNASGADDGLSIDNFSMSLLTPTAVTLSDLTATSNNASLITLLAALCLIALVTGLIVMRWRRA
jgi:hypothetical protein